MNPSIIDNNLLQQVHNDLTMRARGGIVMYLIVWLLTAFWGEIPGLSPFFFWLNTFLFLLTAIFRAWHYLAHKNTPLQQVAKRKKLLTLLILFSAFHWGIMSAWVIHFSEFEQLHYPYMIIMAAFAVGGTATLCISELIRKLYSLLIFGPTIVMAFIVGGTEYYALASMAVLSVLYILEASRASSHDYFSALENQHLAEQRAKELELLSNTDPLTQLKNRLFFNRRFDEEWKRCDRLKVSLCVLMIDLDHFKQINDRYGHLCGDQCLQHVAEILMDNFPRETDTVARYGGEEFVILLPNTQLGDAQNIASRLVDIMAKQSFSYQDNTLQITCSIGIACTFPDFKQNSDALLNAADNALYNAKDNGRNQWRVASMKTTHDRSDCAESINQTVPRPTT